MHAGEACLASEDETLMIADTANPSGYCLEFPHIIALSLQAGRISFLECKQGSPDQRVIKQRPESSSTSSRQPSLVSHLSWLSLTGIGSATVLGDEFVLRLAFVERLR